MSLYRQAGASRGRLALVALLAALAGIAGGFALGRATAPDPSLAELASEARAAARSGLSALELVEIEYPQGVGSQAQTAAPSELQGARSQAEAVQALLEREDLRALDPDGVARAERAASALGAAIDRSAEPPEIRRLVAEARAAIESLAGEGR